MKNIVICRILSEINPLKYKNAKTCICPIFMCAHNTVIEIPYIQCKIEKKNNPEKYRLSHSCNCKENECKK